MSGTRAAAVAGMFYPDDPQQLRSDIQAMLAGASRKAITPKALIVPHAGYIYSGPIAASAYAQLATLRERIERVILLGPCHHVPLRGLAATSADYFSTPLGSIAIDHQANDQILDYPQVQVFDATHQREHSLEVQLPFLQLVLDDFKLVPLVVGDAYADEVDAVLETLWGGDETLIVISSDLSHYHDYNSARQLDARTCRAIEQLDGSALQARDACGRNPIAGLLIAARIHHLKATTLDLRNSGDTAGDRSRVVGYGAWAFE